MNNSINERLGIERKTGGSSNVEEGFYPIAIYKVTKSQPKAEYGKELSIEIDYEIEGFDNKQWISGKYIRDENGVIEYAGSCQEIWDILDILGLGHAIKKDGSLDGEILAKFQGEDIAEIPTEIKYRKNALAYAYTANTKDGNFTRLFRMILPINASDSEKETVKNEFEGQVKDGYITPVREGQPMGNAVENTMPETNQKQPEEIDNMPGF